MIPGPFQELKYFIRRYKVDLVTLVLAAIGLWISAVLADPKVLFWLSTGITLLSAVIIIYARMRERDFIHLSMTRREHRDNWIGEGSFELSRTDQAFRITDSHGGVILADTLTWSDYRFHFLFRLEKHSLGVVLRAVNLANQVMLQVYQDRIKAHIRINGAWAVFDGLPELTFSQQLHCGTWYSALVTCDKRTVTIRISQRRAPLFNGYWAIPQGTVTFKLTDTKTGSPDLHVPFFVNLDYGAVGFRNYGEESALVKDILIEKL